MSKEKTYIYFLKVFAIFLVIYNHTEAFRLFYTGSTSNYHFIYVFLSSFCKVAVPIFFMCSGALLIEKEDESLGLLFRRKILKYAKVILIFSLIHYFLMLVITNSLSSFNLLDFLKIIYTDKISSPYWYIYYYLGLMIMLPFIRKMAKNMSKIEFNYLISVYILYNFITIVIQALTGLQISRVLNIPIITSDAIFYFMIGYYIDNHISVATVMKMKYSFLILISTLSTVISSMFIIFVNKDGESQSAHSLLISVPTIILFIIFKKISIEKNIDKRIVSGIKSISNATFIIYLLEGILRKYFNPLYLKIAPDFTVILSSIIIILLVISVGYITNYLINKLTVIKKILL